MNIDIWLPVVFLGLMGLAVLIYAILDGYDLGVGILLPVELFSRDSAIDATAANECISGAKELDSRCDAKNKQRDTMIASIGPFWDANETWLVLAVGILLIAFPSAHSQILRELYIPATIMLAGLILRGVAFDFRAKVALHHKLNWDKVFKIGSILTSLSQGYMLGSYVIGFDQSIGGILFSIVSAICVTAAYSYIGAAWLVMKTTGQLQKNAARWARKSGYVTALGVITVCLVNVLVNARVFEKWFSFPDLILLLPIPLLCLLLFGVVDRYLKYVPHNHDFGCWIPFAAIVGIFFLCFQGLAYSFYPYVIPNQMDVWQAASASESLMFIFYGAVIVVPTILGYTIFSYRVFWGKAGDLRYY